LLLVNVLASAVGIFCARISSFAKILEASMRAADSSGQTRAIFQRQKDRQSLQQADRQDRPPSGNNAIFPGEPNKRLQITDGNCDIFPAVSAVPAFPGAQKIRPRRRLRDLPRQRVLRPPPPMIRNFMENCV
jgi:hypothetical protein